MKLVHSGKEARYAEIVAEVRGDKAPFAELPLAGIMLPPQDTVMWELALPKAIQKGLPGRPISTQVMVRVDIFEAEGVLGRFLAPALYVHHDPQTDAVLLYDDVGLRERHGFGDLAGALVPSLTPTERSTLAAFSPSILEPTSLEAVDPNVP